MAALGRFRDVRSILHAWKAYTGQLLCVGAKAGMSLQVSTQALVLRLLLAAALSHWKLLTYTCSLVLLSDC